MPLSYIPKVKCLKCNRELELRDFSRSYARDGSREIRTLVASCHGAKIEIPFALEPDTEVELWSA